MDNFSISQLYQFSGIKPHTIRMWEQRYNALNPDRSKGNTRYYDNSQLKRLLNIVSLMNAEHKISELCSMPDKHLQDLSNNYQKKNLNVESSKEYFVSQLISAGMSYDELEFEKHFSKCLNRFGVTDTYKKIIYPLLVRIGLMWTNDVLPPAHEHFISNLIRQKLFSAIDLLPSVKSLKHRWLLFLPENEFHDIGLLFSNYIIQKAGKKVIYLGSNIPWESLVSAVSDIQPSHLLLFLVHNDLPANAQKYLKALTTNFKKTKIHLSGNENLISGLKLSNDLHWIRSVDDLEKIL